MPKKRPSEEMRVLHAKYSEGRRLLEEGLKLPPGRDRNDYFKKAGQSLQGAAREFERLGRHAQGKRIYNLLSKTIADLNYKWGKEPALEGADILYEVHENLDGIYGSRALHASEKSMEYESRQEERVNAHLEERKKRNTKGLERSVSLIIAVIGIIGGLFIFSSPIITGNTIARLNTSISNIIGAVLLILGIVSLYFYFRIKK